MRNRSINDKNMINLIYSITVERQGDENQNKLYARVKRVKFRGHVLVNVAKNI